MKEEKIQPEEENQELQKEEIVHPFETEEGKKKKFGASYIVVAVIIVAVGIVLGSFAGLRNVKEQSPSVQKVELKKGEEVGLQDKSTFRDSAEGVIERNDDGDGEYKEGSHRLLRGDDESQTVYLTSSAVDLDVYVGKRVKVWGETHTGLKVAWLMDVGLVELLE